MSTLTSSITTTISFGGEPSSPASSQAAAVAMLLGYRPGIYSFIRRKGFSSEEADDLTQETLLRAYLHLHTFEGSRRGSMGAWLFRIALNVTIDFLRKRRVSTVCLDQASWVASSDEDPLAGLDHDERQAQVLSVMERLPECHRNMLRLRYYEGRSMAEIALQMGCSPTAAKLRVFRAVSALRKRFQNSSMEGCWTA